MVMPSIRKLFGWPFPQVTAGSRPSKVPPYERDFLPCVLNRGIVLQVRHRGGVLEGTMTITTPQVTAPQTSRPTNMNIRAADLKVDLFNASEIVHGYQRDPDAKFKKLVEKIKKDFQPDLFLPLSVAEWQGEYFVYDGNARRTVALEIAADPHAATKYPEAWAFFGSTDPVLECRVTMNCHPKQQAVLFVRANEDRRGMPWLNRHHARLFQGDPVAIEIERVVAAVGLRVDKGKGNISAVQALYSTIQFGGEGAPLQPQLLADVLHVANLSWCVGRTVENAQYCFSDRTLDALALLFSRFNAATLPRDEAIRSFQTVLIKDLVNRSAKATSAHGSNNKTALAKEMLKKFNEKTPQNPTGRKLRKSRLDPAPRRQRRA